MGPPRGKCAEKGDGDTEFLPRKKRGWARPPGHFSAGVRGLWWQRLRQGSEGSQGPLFPRNTHVCVQSVVLEAASQLRVKTPYKFLRSRKRPRVSRSVAEERAGDTAAVNPGHTSTKVDPCPVTPAREWKHQHHPGKTAESVPFYRQGRKAAGDNRDTAQEEASRQLRSCSLTRSSLRCSDVFQMLKSYRYWKTGAGFICSWVKGGE